MTLNISEAEMRVVEELAQKKDLTKTAIMRQALRLYQTVSVREARGEHMVFVDANGARCELRML